MDSLLCVCRKPMVSYQQKPHCRAMERTFSKRYLLQSNFATLIFTGRYRNEASMLGVLFPYATSVSLLRGCTLSWHTKLYNTQWRGLAELLISVKGNAKARLWDKQGSFSHVFFISITEVLTFNAEAGRVVGEFCYGRKWS